MTMAAAPFGAADASSREPRELAALGRATEWINSPRLTPPALAGKVVLVDFWTYTCINWLRTLPYVRAWARKYQQSLVVIGVVVLPSKWVWFGRYRPMLIAFSWTSRAAPSRLSPAGV